MRRVIKFLPLVTYEWELHESYLPQILLILVIICMTLFLCDVMIAFIVFKKLLQHPLVLFACNHTNFQSSVNEVHANGGCFSFPF